MKTKAEFVDRWKHHLAGMALFGLVSEKDDGPLARAGKWYKLPDEVERLLGAMYDDLAKSAAAAPPQSNSQPRPAQQPQQPPPGPAQRR